jgi:hypothetical protein
MKSLSFTSRNSRRLNFGKVNENALAQRLQGAGLDKKQPHPIKV